MWPPKWVARSVITGTDFLTSPIKEALKDLHFQNFQCSIFVHARKANELSWTGLYFLAIPFHLQWRKTILCPWKRTYFPTNQFPAYDKKKHGIPLKRTAFLPNIPAAPGPISLPPSSDLSNNFPCKLPIKLIQFLILHTPILKMEAVCYFETSASAYKSNQKIIASICIIIV
jgi:hypothetical protein